MKIITRTVLSAAVLGFVACSGTEEKANTPSAAITPLNLSAPAQPTGAPAQGATAGLNPEHGQPNHRCDIPVGASLSLPVQPNLGVQPTVAPPAPSTKGVIAVDVNPPHGELGHDCSIPVGAPLNK
ncbi:hypothetical protein CLV24_11371 [Pontibacter ummariensis]|uniref:Lipoprotein n=1 Tax=Pontibacter ummariensis TaxID=1610492 RepID=A0A239HCC1_9BACT|nr:hypothetical protein [Pontibacter ummariensis]PRY10652.1 hypothetical protein CLV24_11371 [Pontibacter ummariensis]SNS79027.1 hypothetical protein SAMN06296052_11384 [Pontibacter ummariensis]